MKGIPDLDIEALWTYHPPTPVTEPLYAAIRAMYGELTEGRALNTFQEVGEGTQRFARLIQLKCPNCYDTNAAVEKCAMARMAWNEALVTKVDARVEFFGRLGVQYLTEARWLACRAIALHGGAEVF